MLGLQAMKDWFRKDTLIVIPAYNSAHCLPALLYELLQRVDPQYILVVDDGSTDDTSTQLKDFAIHQIKHPLNRGKGAALSSGLHWAQAKGFTWILTLDADGQHAIEDLKTFMALPLKVNTGIVVGQRSHIGSDMPMHRRFSNWSTTAAVSLLAGQSVFDAQCGFRLYRSSLAKALPTDGRFQWEAQALVLCARLGYGFQAVPIKTLYTGNGSHMQLLPDTLRFLQMMWILLWTTGPKRALN
jgi:glycosyltransferase involved in cell wall biosynthesis